MPIVNTNWNGASAWGKLHRFALAWDGDVAGFNRWLEDFSIREVQCGSCQSHWNASRAANPPDLFIPGRCIRMERKGSQSRQRRPRQARVVRGGRQRVLDAGIAGEHRDCPIALRRHQQPNRCPRRSQPVGHRLSAPNGKSYPPLISTGHRITSSILPPTSSPRTLAATPRPLPHFPACPQSNSSTFSTRFL